MKAKIVYLLLLVIALTACKDNDNVYAEELKNERKLIENYIKRNGIVVVETEPTSMDEWKDNVYWKVPDYDNFYFHLVVMGDTTFGEVTSNDEILLRFRRYTLDVYADTIYNWSSQDSPVPVKLQYMVQSDQSCTGWQLAIKYMKYPYAECKIICPSKLGFMEENNAVIPYGYDLKRTDNPIIY